MASNQQPYPLYNTTYTLHRLSPLYTPHTSSFTTASLQPYARSLLDILAGDTLRGVRVGLGADEDILTRVGALQTVSWRKLPEEDLWEAEDVDLDTTIGVSSGRGILVAVTYEKATYTAILLKDEQDKRLREEEGFQYFPLLLTRMPGSLRETFIQFLAMTFDARVSPLLLGKEYVVRALEGYIMDCGRDEDGELQLADMGRVLRAVVRDVQVVIGFEAGTSLKTVEVLVAREDVMRLVLSGRRLERQDSAGTCSDVLRVVTHSNRTNANFLRTRIAVYGCVGELYRCPSWYVSHI
jgi:hypothetical protein